MLNFLLITAVASQAQDALSRHANYMAAGQVSASFTVRDPSVTATGKGRVDFLLPNSQKFTLKWAGQDFEYRHSSQGGMSIRYDRKEYHESAPFDFNPTPPPAIAGLAIIGYPLILGAPNLLAFSGNAQWESLGTQTIRGQVCDRLSVNLSAPPAGGQHTVWVDQEGRIQRWRRVINTQSESYDIVMDFSDHTQSVPSDLRHYDMTLPTGFMPAHIPLPRTRTLQVQNVAVFGDWLNARKNDHEDVKRLVDGVPVVIVFTDPDCAISQTLEPYLVKLRKRLKKEECALIEVSLGRKKPTLKGKDTERPVYWDRLGSIESAYGTPGTPYFLLTDSNGRLARGWQGYSKKREYEITRELLRAFEG